MSDLLNSASLVMVPSGYKEDTVYSVVPTNGNGDLSFTRASNGTRINSAGLVEVCPWNLVEYSEQFDNAYWGNSNSTITANSTTAPNGTTTADTFTRNAGTAYLYNGSFNLGIGEFTQSVYAKANASSSIRLEFVTSAFNRGAACIFDLSNGTAGTITIYGGVSGFTASIESVGNGWYRCSLGGTITIADTYFWEISITTGSIYVWGAQLNIGSTAKPYFPTTDRLNVPRLTYQNGGGGCPSLLLEKQSTNFARNWNFTAATWSTNAITLTANAGTSPDGTNNAFLIYPITSGTDRFIYDDQGSAGYSANTNYTTTVYAKAAGLNWAYIRFENKSNFNSYVSFNLATGVVGSTTGSVTIVSKTIEAMGNGWYRLRVTANMGTGSAGNNNVLFGVADADASTYATASGTNGVLFYGPQSEQSDYPTSPIPTNGSSATRVADYAYKTSATALIGQTEGVLFCDFNLPSVETSNDYPFVVNLWEDGDNRFGFARYPNGGVHIYMISGGSGQFTHNTTQLTGRFKLALGYKANDCVIYLNGSLVQTITTATIPATSQIVFNAINNFGAYNTQSQINQAVLFKTRLTNAELASLTTI